MSRLVQPPPGILANQSHGFSGIGESPRKTYTGAESISGQFQSINNPPQTHESDIGKHHDLPIPAGLYGALVSWEPNLLVNWWRLTGDH